MKKKIDPYAAYNALIDKLSAKEMHAEQRRKFKAPTSRVLPERWPDELEEAGDKANT